MAEEIKTKPTPIQRNVLDVATELTQMYYGNHGMGSLEEIQQTFLKFYAMAETARLTHYKHMIEYLPEDFKKVVQVSSR